MREDYDVRAARELAWREEPSVKRPHGEHSLKGLLDVRHSNIDRLAVEECRATGDSERGDIGEAAYVAPIVDEIRIDDVAELGAAGNPRAESNDALGPGEGQGLEQQRIGETVHRREPLSTAGATTALSAQASTLSVHSPLKSGFTMRLEDSGPRDQAARDSCPAGLEPIARIERTRQSMRREK